MTELRKSLESIKVKHEEEISNLQSEVEEANESKEHYETQYKNLFAKINTLRSSLGDRVKADAVCISLTFFHLGECDRSNVEQP